MTNLLRSKWSIYVWAYGSRAWNIVIGRGSIIETLNNGAASIPNHSEEIAAMMAPDEVWLVLLGVNTNGV